MTPTTAQIVAANQWWDSLTAERQVQVAAWVAARKGPPEQTHGQDVLPVQAPVEVGS